MEVVKYEKFINISQRKYKLDLLKETDTKKNLTQMHVVAKVIYRKNESNPTRTKLNC